MSKIIMHIDLNAFFVTAEEIRNPSLIGKPVAIGGKGRGGIVSTCSYEARKYGVSSGQPTFISTQKCKQLIILPVDYKYYKLLSNEFFHFLSKHSNIIEVGSIDECYVDMTKALTNCSDPVKYLRKMQLDLLKKTGLKCSIGISTTKFLAKMASDLEKPLGLTIIRKKDIPQFLYNLPVRNFYGIGKKSSERIASLGINTIGELVREIEDDNIMLNKVLGKFTHDILDCIHGKTSDVVVTEERTPKSIGHSHTLDFDTADYEDIKPTLINLCLAVSQRTKNQQMEAFTITITIKDSEFRNYTKSVSIEEPTNDYEVIFRVCENLYFEKFTNKKIRLIGVSLSKLIDEGDFQIQLDLFNIDKYKQKNEIVNIIDSLNKKLSKPLLSRVSDLKD